MFFIGADLLFCSDPTSTQDDDDDDDEEGGGDKVDSVHSTIDCYLSQDQCERLRNTPHLID